MRNIILRASLLLTLFAILSCAKEETATQPQTVYFPDGRDIYIENSSTIFEMDNLNAAIEIPGEGDYDKEIGEALAVLESISTPYSPYRIMVYGPVPDFDAADPVPQGNISLFIKPSSNTLDKLSNEYLDLTPYKGYDMVAVSDDGDICLVKEFLDGDVLGSFNGLVRWANDYCYWSEVLKDGPKGSNDLPEATELFKNASMDETINFSYVDKVVATVVCSDKDKQSGNGTVEIHYSITPMHAFDDQTGRGDYYYVHGTALLHSSRMYHGRYTKVHGGVHARICAFYARQLDIESYISDKSGKVVGNFVSGGQPSPGTTIGSTTYTSGVNWSFNGSLTGGQTGGKDNFILSLTAGVQINKSYSRTVSDLNITLDQSGMKAKYKFEFPNCPKYEPIQITAPTAISTSTATLPFSYIVHVPEVRDDSTEEFLVNFKVSEIDYGSCRFYSTGADFKDFHWKINDTEEKQKISEVKSIAVRPNRVPTGSLDIIHNNAKFGKYIYKVTANNVNTGKQHIFDKNQYAQGQTATIILPTGDYSITMETGDSKDKLNTIVTDRNVKINRGTSSQILTGANFILK